MTGESVAVPALARAALAALNHLLGQQAWARDKLRAHAGRVVKMQVDSPLGMAGATARIADDGTLLMSAEDASPNVTLTLKPSVNAAFGFVQGGARALASHLKVEGDVMVAAAVGEVAQHLRWEAEEDLSRLVGDRLAHRAGQAMRSAVKDADVQRKRIESGLLRFLLDEQPTLVARSELDQLRNRLRDLHRRMDRLEAQATARSLR